VAQGIFKKVSDVDTEPLEDALPLVNLHILAENF
jgi:hypothetical protein